MHTKDSKDVPKLKEYVQEFGECYEYDILFWKRYVIDKGISPLAGVRIVAHESDLGLEADSVSPLEGGTDVKLNCICFDIETYNAAGTSEPQKDPVLMISYTDGNRFGVLTTKKIDREFVTSFGTEKEMIEGFAGPDQEVGRGRHRWVQLGELRRPYLTEEGQGGQGRVRHHRDTARRQGPCTTALWNPSRCPAG